MAQRAVGVGRGRERFWLGHVQAARAQGVGPKAYPKQAGLNVHRLHR